MLRERSHLAQACSSILPCCQVCPPLMPLTPPQRPCHLMANNWPPALGTMQALAAAIINPTNCTLTAHSLHSHCVALTWFSIACSRVTPLGPFQPSGVRLKTTLLVTGRRATVDKSACCTKNGSLGVLRKGVGFRVCTPEGGNNGCY